MMSDQQFDIIFRGDIVFGHQLADVKARLQQLFKADAAKVDALFSGRPIPLKRGLDQASAQKYKDALINAGAQVDIVLVEDKKSNDVKPDHMSAHEVRASEISGAAATSAAVLRAVTPTPVASPLTLAQRLEQQEVAAKFEAEATAAREALARARATHDQDSVDPQADWSLAPVGADLLQPAEKITHQPISIDTSALSLRAEGGNILDVSERASESIPTVVAPDFEVAEVGADLVRADEKMDLPLLEIELEDWSLSDLGEDLIAASEKPVAQMPVIHIPDVGLAPAGSDLGQIKPKVEALNPDISGIRLAD